ncbi:uncharacterized protein I303_104682 [Kwoniella dejecticola CBS 10117]|uniref:Uncharacterized protein n=1 Tax=Kwoniella dejecticola CBS 10117 TaxID=1296121 RepID=A0AAJ8MIB5_9TREE
MPVTATKGVRGKFYRELAQQTRQVETLVVGPSTFGFGSVTVRSESSNPSKISSFPSPVARTKHYLPKKPQMAFSQHHEATEHPSRRDSGRSCDDDDDGWGSPPTPTRRKKSNSQSVSRNTLSRISVSDKMEDRAQLTKHDSLVCPHCVYLN